MLPPLSWFTSVLYQKKFFTQGTYLPHSGLDRMETQKIFLSFWVLLDLIRSEITIKHIFEAYKVHRIALEVSKVSSV